MPDYSKTVIYIIRCLDLGITETYVGSTVNPTSRKSGHHNACYDENNKSHNYRIYQFIRANGGWDNWEFVILEEYPECNSKIQKCIRERQVADRLQSQLNTNRAYTTIDEKAELTRHFQLINNPIYNPINNKKTTFCPTCDDVYYSRNFKTHCLTYKHLSNIVNV